MLLLLFDTPLRRTLQRRIRYATTKYNTIPIRLEDTSTLLTVIAFHTVFSKSLLYSHFFAVLYSPADLYFNKAAAVSHLQLTSTVLIVIAIDEQLDSCIQGITCFRTSSPSNCFLWHVYSVPQQCRTKQYRKASFSRRRRRSRSNIGCCI